MKTNVTVKLGALLGVAFLVAAVATVLSVPPANQYELSLYDALPAHFWLFTVGAMTAGLLVIVASARRPGDRNWTYGLATVLLTNAMLLAMPHLRGYAMVGRADALSHIGYVQDITLFGSFGSNIYPKMHILVKTVADATGTEPMTIALTVPIAFSTVYFGSMFYLLAHLFDDRKRILLGLPFALLPVLGFSHLGVRPFDLSVMLVPLTFYLFVKAQQSTVPAVRAAFVIALLSTLLYHPLTALFLLGIIGLWVSGKYLPLVRADHATPTNVLSLSAVVFVAWYSNFTSIIIRFERVFDSILGEGEGASPADQYSETAGEASIAFVDIVRVVTFRYGTAFVLFCLAFAFIALAGTLLYRREYAPDRYTLMFAGTLAVFSFGGLSFLLMDLIVGHDRPWQIAKLAAVVLAGGTFYLAWYRFEGVRRRPTLRTAFNVSLVAVILVLVVLTTFSLYESPLMSERNHQVTEMELDGTEWITEHGTATDELDTFGTRHWRHHHALYGTEAPNRFSESEPPPHFNYQQHETLGQSYPEDRYVTITRHGRIVYPQGFPDYPENWRYTPEDFDRLERDDTVDRVYDNGDYDQYLVDGVGDEETETAG